MWVSQQSCISTSQSTLYLPKGTGRVGERRYTLCQVGFLSLGTSQRFSRAHILAASLCRSPYPHTPVGVWVCAQPCAAVQRVALQTFTIHQVWELAGCVPNTPGLQDDTGLLTTSSVFTQEQRELYEILGPVGCVGCFALRLLLRVSSRSDCCPLVQPGSCSRVKIEGFLFQNSSRAGGLSPMHLPNQSWHLFSLPV